MAITFTQADLDRLKEAYATGASRVRIGDREIEYRSQADLLAAIKAVDQALNGVSDDQSQNTTMIQAGYSRARRCEE